MEVETEHGPGLASRDAARVLKMRTDAALPRSSGTWAAGVAGGWQRAAGAVLAVCRRQKAGRRRAAARLWRRCRRRRVGDGSTGVL